MPKLIYKDPDTGSQVVVEINEEVSEVTVGRNPGNIIRINNPSVSRRHTKFVYENGRVTLYDLNSSNGTYVNGMRIQDQALEDGDLVRVGEFPLEYVDEPEPASTMVEDGQVADSVHQKQGGMKSTHLGVGAMGMGGEDTGRGGAMSTRESDRPVPPKGTNMGVQGGPGDESAEFVLGEDDIEEVMEPEPIAAGGGPDDQTIEAAVDMAIGVQQGQQGQQQPGESFADPSQQDDSDQTRRADGNALASKLQGVLEEGTAVEGENQEKLRELREQVRTLRAELEKAPDREQFAAVRAERDELKAECDEAKAQRDQANTERDNLQAERDNLRAKHADLRAESADLRAERDELQTLISQRDERIEQLEQQLQDAQNAAAQAQAEAGGDEQLQVQLQQKDEQLEELRDQIADFEADQDKKKAIFKELAGDLKELVAGNKELKQELKVVKQERDSLMETIEQLEGAGAAGDTGGDEAYQQLQEEKESLEETLAEVILERDRLEDQLQQERDAS